jgi:hypothetical protein
MVLAQDTVQHCSTGGFDISGVDPAGSTTRHLVTGCQEVNWIRLAYDSAQWRSLVSVLWHLWIPQKMRNFLTG